MLDEIIEYVERMNDYGYEINAIEVLVLLEKELIRKDTTNEAAN